MNKCVRTKWEETTVIDQATRSKELLLKEAIHIWLLRTPLPRDGGGGGLPCKTQKAGPTKRTCVPVSSACSGGVDMRVRRGMRVCV